MTKIKLINSTLEALVDDEDANEIKKFSWYAIKSQTNKYYAHTKIGGKTVYMHSLVMQGKIGFTVDHISRDTLDNRRCNLRYATLKQQLMNTDKYKRSWECSSKYKGVSWDSWSKSWVARIKIGKKYRNLGRFYLELDAANAYNKAAAKYFKEFAKLNSVPDDEDSGKA